MAKEAAKHDSVAICHDISADIVDKAATKVRDKLLNAMRPAFVRKQMLIRSRESAVIYRLKPDKNACEVDQ